jgi:hypothetical protein
METLKTYINRHAKKLSVVLIITATVLTTLNVRESNAQSSTALTGKCGMLYNRSLFGLDTALDNYQNVSINSLILVDLDANTVQVTDSSVSNYGRNNVAINQTTISLPFTKATGPITGSTTITVAVPGAGEMKFNILPVNSGNTFLVQVVSNQTAPGSGICQKV